MFSKTEIKIIKNLGSVKGRQSCIAKITREIDTTYAHTSKVLQRLLNSRILKSSSLPDKRKKAYQLTEKGEKTREILINLENVLKQRGWKNEKKGWKKV